MHQGKLRVKFSMLRRHCICIWGWAKHCWNPWQTQATQQSWARGVLALAASHFMLWLDQMDFHPNTAQKEQDPFHQHHRERHHQEQVVTDEGWGESAPCGASLIIMPQDGNLRQGTWNLESKKWVFVSGLSSDSAPSPTLGSNHHWVHFALCALIPLCWATEPPVQPKQLFYLLPTAGAGIEWSLRFLPTWPFCDSITFPPSNSWANCWTFRAHDLLWGRPGKA